MVVTLYKIDASPPVRAVHMTVEILGLNIETKEVNTVAGEQFKPEYLGKNPTHTVPMIEDGDFVLADSHAIITYLVSKYGSKHANLYPADLKIRATIDHRMFVDATLVFPKIRSIVISVLREKAAGPSPQQISEVNEAYGFLEKFLERSTYLAGDDLTLADISCVSSVSSLNALVPVSDSFPKLKKWWENIAAHDWYQKANVPGLTQFEGFLKIAMQQNARQ